jgi:hypothetical protein
LHDQRPLWKDAGWLLASVAALLVVGGLLAAGVAPGRLLPAAGFLVLCVAGTTAGAAASALRRRARSPMARNVPRGVRLRRPMWTDLEVVAPTIAFGAALGAGASLLGLPGVGAGLLGVAALIAAAFVAMSALTGIRGVTLEGEGLRIAIGRGAAFVPWTSMASVGLATGVFEGNVEIRLRDGAPLMAKLWVSTTWTRLGVQIAGLRPGGTVMLDGGLGGFDAGSLARAISWASGLVREQAN